VVTYFVPSTGILRINGASISNSTVTYPYATLSAESLPGTGYSFYNFTENSVYYNSNPSTITFPVINFMADYYSNITMILGAGGLSEEDLAIYVIISGIITASIVGAIFLTVRKKINA
jgi:hypothetical protein